MAEEKLKVAPGICAYVDDEHTRLTMEIVLPGVPKENVKLRMHEDSFSLSAPKEDVEYVTALSFCCPVNPDKAKAKYKDGLLRLEVPFKDPMEDAVTVPIS